MASPSADSFKKRSRRVRKQRQWDQSSNKISKEWDKIFQDKFNIFQDMWTLKIAEDESHLPSQNEWKRSLEERVSMAFKCKDCNHVWLSDDGAVCFYYLLNKGKNGNDGDGKVFVWLRPQTCPSSCSMNNVPLMDISKNEIEAAISYLVMEIGFHCYQQRHYTKNDEDLIESRRLIRGKKSNKKMNSQSVLSKKDPILSDQLPTHQKSLQSGSQKPKNVKTQRPTDVKRITKLRNRWDKTPEEIKKQWELSFESIFHSFTEKNPSDRWIMSMEKVAKDHPLQREKKWMRFLGEKVEAGFICPKCHSVWESRRAWISFWVWLNPPNSDGKRLGEVVVHVLGQKCISCPNNSSKPYIIGDLQGEEIDAVLSFLYMDIDYFFYHNYDYTHLDEERIEEKKNKNKPPIQCYGKGVHRKECCQACRLNVCRKKITAVYPILPSASPLA